MNAEDLAKFIIENILSEDSPDKNKIKNLAKILHAIYQMGQGKGEDDMRGKISPLLNLPESDSNSKQIKELLSGLLSRL
ncbi:hypothetical protein MNBD_GAMMA09-145 [hydrothermal vent metagenome]|uniref:Uncharacterized protein n=1 Tax=hydrothermal vent metagenome TaxID=652676 RepID=A0A3B0YA60_9ZZZZ